MSASGDPNKGLTYWERCGQEFDIACNVLLGGDLGMTVSMRCALAALAGKHWAVVARAVLSRIVQRNHCTATLSSTPSPWFVYLRAGIAFAVAIAAVGAMVWALVELLIRLLGVL